MARKRAAKTARTSTRATVTADLTPATVTPATVTPTDLTRADLPRTERAVADDAGARVGTATGRRVTVVAHLVTGEDIKSALLSSDDELDVEFEGDDPRDQRATVTTDAGGVLTWALVLETAFSDAAWRLTLTKRGDTEGPPDADGTTDGQGRAVPSAIKTF